MTTLLLVRHADAGDRAAWRGDDVGRPLTSRGVAQALALADLLAPLLADPRTATSAPSRVTVRSSPARRCLETVAPLAARLGTEVVDDDGLFEGASAARLLARLPHLSTATVWASHGDVIPALLMELARDGVDLGDDPRCRKASTWLLDLTPDGAVSSATYVDRPD
jgi:broad specificity phosphatase PhoE